MPSGVFRPYAGVGGTDKVWFYDMQVDGLSLDDKRTPLIGEDQWEGLFEPRESSGRKSSFKDHDKCNIPDILQRWFTRDKDEYESMFNSLMQRAFKGEFTTPGAKAA